MAILKSVNGGISFRKQLILIPRLVFEVYGGSTDGGITPDATTQASIDALVAQGIPLTNIIWNYTI